MSAAVQSAPAAVPAIAVIDIGSNSGRVVVYQLETFAHFRILASARASLRLVRDLDRAGRISDQAAANALEALRDFAAVARRAGAQRIVAVATAAMREAQNGPELIDLIRAETGIEVQTIDGQEEGRYGFVGAVRGLPVESGLVFDMGGGSAQITRFEQRRSLQSWSLPLGALRLSVGFLERDPPKGGEIDHLVEHVRRLIRDAGVPWLRRGEVLVGTGGTVRNLAKIEMRQSGYPISRLHGYLLARGALREIAERLASIRAKRRADLPGLSHERADSIVGGAFGIKALMVALGAGEVMVSGQGVREGLVASLVSDRLPDVVSVRRDSIGALSSRFLTWDAGAAAQRATLVRGLYEGLEPEPRPELRELLEHAATLLDVGRSIDFYNRYDHAADVVMGTELDGFSHHDVAMLSALLRRAKDPHADLRRYRAVLEKWERPLVERAAVLLLLADDLEKRCPPNQRVELTCRLSPGRAVVAVPQLAAWRPWPEALRFEQAFGVPLQVMRGAMT